MRSAFKGLWLGASVLMLTACGGGGELSPSGATGGDTSTDGSTETVVGALDGYTLALTPQNTLGESIDSVSANDPAIITATLLSDGAAVSSALIQFSLVNEGALNPSSGRVLTDANGQAKITVLSGSEPGVAVIDAAYTLEDETLDQSVNLNVAGDAVTEAGEVISGAALLALSLNNQASGEETTVVSAENPAVVNVVLTNTDNEALARQVVSFSSTLGNFLPVQATALTDELGRADIILNAGSVEGAGEITVSYGGISQTLGFVTQGDEIDPVEAAPAIEFAIYDCHDNSAYIASERNFEVCEITNNITNEKSGLVGGVITREGSTQVLSEVLVTAVTTLGGITPDSGTAITNADGKVVFDLYADSAVGAGQVTLQVQNETSTKAFEIGRVDISLAVATVLPEGETLPAGGSTIVEVDVFNADGSLATGQPFTLELTSECVTAGKATIDSPVITNAGKGVATYRAMGCEGEDTITVSAISGSNAVTSTTSLTVDAVEIGSLQYISAEPLQLALKGSSGVSESGSRSETSVVTFQLLDANGDAASQEKICFALTTAVGGLSISPAPNADDYGLCNILPESMPTDDAAYAVASTDSQGFVSVTVNAGSVPTPVKVKAQWADSDVSGFENVISNTSAELVISTGLADADSFSIAPSMANPEGWAFDGETVTITARAADFYNNSVPAGTPINFRAEGGRVDAQCTTGETNGLPNGTCSVTWDSSNPRPFADTAIVCPNNFDGTSDAPCVSADFEDYTSATGGDFKLPEPRPGRATVTAYLIGEESFIDLNGNGLYDSSDYFPEQYDLSEAFEDHNLDGEYRDNKTTVNGEGAGSFDEGETFEEFIDYNSDGQFNAADNKYTGSLCAEGAEANCTQNGEGIQLHVFQQTEIIMSGSVAKFKVAELSGTTLSVSDGIDVTTEASETIQVFISDVNNNPLPFGTTITAETSNGELSAGSPASLTLGSSTALVPKRLVYTIEQEATANGKTTGQLVITIKTPLGEAIAIPITVTDAG